jgi:predicted amidohydrolase YtcJ
MLIENGTVYGTGAPSQLADVAVAASKIAEVGNSSFLEFLAAAARRRAKCCVPET